MKTTVSTVTEADFEATVLSSSLPVLVDFTAAWCGPCRVIEPILETIAERHGGRVRVVRVDADASASIAARYGVRALPTVISFNGGKEHKRHMGATSMAKLLGLLPEDASAAHAAL